MNNRLLITLIAAVLLGGVAVGYTVLSGAPPEEAAHSVAAGSGPRLMVLTNGTLSTVSRTDPAGPREVTEQRCDRVYSAAGTISCLRPVGALKAGELAVLDRGLKELKTVPLTGFPNRTRVSASGRMVAWTLFVDGHSYAANGFSTSTGILDTKTGALVQSLEEFTVEGMPQRPVDVNYWGVTFTADDNRFYATMSTGGHRYLLEGDFAARTVRPLTDSDNVECPSLSPDGTRIAYKAAVDGDPQKGWRVSVLDLATRAVTPLAETRSVDDQPAWIDDRTVAYSLQRDDGSNDVWSVPADGSGAPAVLVPEASSPAPVDQR
ncbi:WD40-like Beta Propeller Repeat [Lentzea xinjiangensis]|uniref:WD40-like Beta Propeller Repeat n=1 Tax=Lentzea xinjiangensis TaxID=402600 RepID=A0A1H9NYT0_9PSEU|nr:PD40 domain-containing protein [Lentzea xinjiangensis]SER41088.1 WD40-like Beta Propeller Repeat [Lentzea xinjiangensis]